MEGARTTVIIQGNDRDGVTTHPEMVAQNVLIDAVLDQYQMKYPHCSSIMITVVNHDKPSPWMAGGKAASIRSGELRYGG